MAATNRAAAITLSPNTATAKSGSGWRDGVVPGVRGRSIGGVGIAPESTGTAAQRPDSRLDRRESITDAGHGQDVPRQGWVGLDLAPQVADVHVDHPRLDRMLVPPDRAEDALAGQHAPRIRGEVGEQVELGVREGDVSVVAGHP